MGLPNIADPGASLQVMVQQNYPVGMVPTPLIGPVFQQQQPLTTPVFSPAGYPQTGMWGQADLSDYRTAIPLANGYTPQNAVVDSAFMPTQSTIHPGLSNGAGLGQPPPFGLPMASNPIDDGFSHYRPGTGHTPLYALQSLSLKTAASVMPPSANGEAASPARFKERTLQHAHKVYNDLLQYLSQSKKGSHARGSSGSRGSGKMVVYPKPSRTPTTNDTHGRISAPTYPEPTASFSHHFTQKDAAARAAGLGSPKNLMVGNAHDRVAAVTPTITAEILGGSNALINPYSIKPIRGIFEMGASPLHNAKASLDILSTLSEQSGWKWVDGMLLGGCLHYGLEHYEDALEWFKRIVNLDAK